MLYITTRNQSEVFTFYKPLTCDRGPDGGLFRPFRLPIPEEQDLNVLQEKNLGQCIADAINLFFSSDLSGWDVDFCIGRSPVQVKPLNRKIYIAEAWHNQEWNMDWMEQQLYERTMKAREFRQKPTEWFRIAVRIGMLAGTAAELWRSGSVRFPDPIDAAVCADDFLTPMAAWYARKMGFPIGNIICSCNDECGLWELFNHGQLHGDLQPVFNHSKEINHCFPSDLERLIYETLGSKRLSQFLSECDQKQPACVKEEERIQISQGFYTAVVSPKRILTTIRSEFRAKNYLLGPYAAMAYNGLQDYRAEIGESRPTVIWSEKSPGNDSQFVADALGVSVKTLMDQIDH